MLERKKIVIIGCGNVAWHIAKQLNKKFDLMVFNHKANPLLASFKSEFNAQTYSSFKNIPANAESYFVCVNDSSIPSVIKALEKLPAATTVLITSGNFDLSSVKTKLRGLSIFYPLQTFSKNDKIKWKETPIIIDAKNSAAILKVKLISTHFNKQVIQLDHAQRIKIHLAAVLANNFTNSLFVEAEKLVRSAKRDLGIELLLPLIKQGIRKLKNMSPKAAQTGPAKRKDAAVMQKHLELLKNNKEHKQIYTLLSDLIAKQQK
jgi:predicted short-subunit dehydrogenase-like oxidoreductase (DUF2520 family)